ncbi:twin-arginine translocase subunit TatB [Parasphingopyxis algicola]|uniref:Sec-independent protein translocase protein TatB n=1 Tax=Parasphingopyxis algicola TaxID=2026624 RepID=UPI0015A06964|nr:Sec-independent protein translocase protein TatB [Parasphingopyxis algicola]QLC26307.1 twin-arginine translocase subunit TatB [Parasphingopyxis algicola]
MFDIGAIELLLVGMVALVIIGPKDLPIAMRTAGRWLGQLRAMTGHFRVGIDAMIREAEIEEQEKAWAEKNAQIMRDHPSEKIEKPEKPEKPQAAEDVAMRPLEESPAPGPDDQSRTDASSETQLPLLPDDPDPKARDEKP